MIIILDGDTAIKGMGLGIDLCLRSVIPALFPFLVLCSMLTGDLSGNSSRFTERLCRICHIPSGAGPILLTGLIGGYPAGARSIDQAHAAGQLTRLQAERMLPLCNQCGPAFLFGMIGSAFPRPWVPWALWAIQLLSVICTAQFLSAEESRTSQVSPPGKISLTQAVWSATKAVAQICAWVTCFKMCITYLDRWILWRSPLPFRTGIIGIMELSNGCLGLPQIDDPYLRFILCSGMLSFGGLCVTMQTFSVISETLDKRPYLRGKLLQSVISIVLSSLFCLCHHDQRFAPIPVSILLMLLLLKKVKIRSRFSRQIHV